MACLFNDRVYLLKIIAVLMACTLSLAVANAGQQTVAINIAQQPLSKALLELSQQTKMVITMSPGLVSDHVAPAVDGTMAPEEALRRLLRGTNLAFEYTEDNAVIIKQAATENAETSSTGSKNRPGMIDEVIVTAQKREQNIYDVPISILAFSSEDIEAQKITDWKNLALSVPGLLVSDNGLVRRTYLRGLGNTSGSASMVGIYIDDISVASGRGDLQIDTRLHDLERVEVLRGPQGTLYGQGSMAGTIRFVTKDPQLDSFGFNADVEASFTQDGAPSQRTQAVVNVPVIKEKFGLRVAGTFEHAGGWIDQPIGDQKDINDQNVSNVRVKGLWHIADALTAKATAIIHRNEAGAAVGEQEDGNITPAFDVLTPGVLDDQYELYNLTLSYDFDSVNLLSTSSYVDSDALSYDAALKGNGYDALFRPVKNEIDIFTQEVRLTSTGTGRLQWTLGGLYEDWEIFQGFNLFIGAPGGPVPSSPLISTSGTLASESWAVFGNISFALTPRLEIGAGLRYFEDDRTQISYTSNVLSGAFKGSFDALSPRFYVNYDLTDDIKVYSSAAKGFRSGGGSTFNLLGGNRSYGPETVWTYELGAKGTSFDGQFIWDVAGFYTDYRDVVVRLQPPGSLGAGVIETNAGNADIVGLEGALTWLVGENLRFGLVGTWLDTEFTSVTGTLRPKLPGDKLDFVRDYQFTIWTEQDFTLASRPGSVRMDYHQQGPSEQLDRFFGTFSESDVINTLNFHITWEWSDNLSLGVFGQNLLNDRGRVDAFLGADGLATSKSLRSRPRTIGVEFGVDF